ncbi:hypothetical protein DFJ73DRAFT_452089 [Zopfochytrium polystomum]|nr:hypothetical protein DFJ73DRAFT_452089 [Zopfochytrium polystomum]
MVDCVKIFLVLFLLPFPQAPSLFLLMLLISMVLDHQPCLYCSVLIMAFLRSSCSFYGSSDDHMGTQSARCWLDFYSVDFLFETRPTNQIYRDPNDIVAKGLVGVSHVNSATAA